MNRGGGRGGRGGGRGYAGKELMKNHYEDLDLDVNELNQSGYQQNRYSNMNEVDGRHPLPLYPPMELPTITPSLDHIKLIQKMRTFHNRVKSSPYYITRNSMEHNDIVRYSDIRKNSLKSGNIISIVKDSMTKRDKDYSELYCPAELFNSKSKTVYNQNSRIISSSSTGGINDLDYSESLLKLEQLEQHNNNNNFTSGGHITDTKEKVEGGSDNEDNELAEADDLEGEDDDYNIDHYADSDNEMDDNFGMGDDNEATF